MAWPHYSVSPRRLCREVRHFVSFHLSHLGLNDMQNHWGWDKMAAIFLIIVINRGHSVYAPSQWETTLHCNILPHWLGACTEWSLIISSEYSLLLGGKSPVDYIIIFQYCWWSLANHQWMRYQIVSYHKLYWGPSFFYIYLICICYKKNVSFFFFFLNHCWLFQIFLQLPQEKVSDKMARVLVQRARTQAVLMGLAARALWDLWGSNKDHETMGPLQGLLPVPMAVLTTCSDPSTSSMEHGLLLHWRVSWEKK